LSLAVITWHLSNFFYVTLSLTTSSLYEQKLSNHSTFWSMYYLEYLEFEGKSMVLQIPTVRRTTDRVVITRQSWLHCRCRVALVGKSS